MFRVRLLDPTAAGCDMAHDDQQFQTLIDKTAFGALAMEVVSVLKARQTGTASLSYHDYARSLLDRRLMTRAHFNPADALEELRALRLSDANIIDVLIPQAARTIGEKWVTSELGFAEVTIGSVRLQSLLTEVEFISPEAPLEPICHHDILIVSREAEQHTLGSFVAAAQLRRCGARVDTMCGERDEDIEDAIKTGDYDAVLFSSSRRRDIDAVEKIAQHAKSVLSDPPLFVLGGLVTEKMEAIDAWGNIDLFTSNVDRVMEYCEQRSTRLLSRARK
jgi:hypothetical protein